MLAHRGVALDLEPGRPGTDRDRIVRRPDEADRREPPQIEDADRRGALVGVDHQIGAAGEHHPVGVRRAHGDRLV